MSRSAERAYLRSARQYHAAPCTISSSTTDEPTRYGVSLDVWDNPEKAAREVERDNVAALAHGRAH